jgi:hypothetical protein
MSADLEAELCRVSPNQLVDAICGDRGFNPAGTVNADRAEQRTALVPIVPGCNEVIMDERIGAGMQRQIPRLASFPVDLEMRHPLTRAGNP